MWYSVETALHAAVEFATGETFHDPIASKIIEVMEKRGYKIMLVADLNASSEDISPDNYERRLKARQLGDR